MFDSSTLYLLLAMATFVFVAVVLVHHHNCNDIIQRKRNAVKNVTARLDQRIELLEQQVVDIQIKIDEIDEQIAALEE